MSHRRQCTLQNRIHSDLSHLEVSTTTQSVSSQYMYISKWRPSSALNNNKMLQSQICDSSHGSVSRGKDTKLEPPDAHCCSNSLGLSKIACQTGGEVTKQSLKCDKLAWVAQWVVDSSRHHVSDKMQPHPNHCHPNLQSSMNEQKCLPSCSRPSQTAYSCECVRCKTRCTDCPCQKHSITITLPREDVAFIANETHTKSSDIMQPKTTVLSLSKAAQGRQEDPSAESRDTHQKLNHPTEESHEKDIIYGRKRSISQQDQKCETNLVSNRTTKLQTVQSHTSQPGCPAISKQDNNEIKTLCRNFSFPSLIMKDEVSSHIHKSGDASQHKTRFSKSSTTHAQFTTATFSRKNKTRHKDADSVQPLTQKATSEGTPNQMLVRAHWVRMKGFQFKQLLLRQQSGLNRIASLSELDVSIKREDLPFNNKCIVKTKAWDITTLPLNVEPLMNPQFSLSTDEIENVKCTTEYPPSHLYGEENGTKLPVTELSATASESGGKYWAYRSPANKTWDEKSVMAEINTTTSLKNITLEMTEMPEKPHRDRAKGVNCKPENNKLDELQNISRSKDPCNEKPSPAVSVRTDLQLTEINNTKFIPDATDTGVSSCSCPKKQWCHLGAGDENNDVGTNSDTGKDNKIFMEEKWATLSNVSHELDRRDKPVLRSVKSYLSKLVEKRSKTLSDIYFDKTDISQSSGNCDSQRRADDVLADAPCELSDKGRVQCTNDIGFHAPSNVLKDSTGSSIEAALNGKATESAQSCNSHVNERSQSLCWKGHQGLAESVTEETDYTTSPLSHSQVPSKSSSAWEGVRTRILLTGKFSIGQEEPSNLKYGFGLCTNTANYRYRTSGDVSDHTKVLAENTNSLKSTSHGVDEQARTPSVTITIRREMPEPLRKLGNESNVKPLRNFSRTRRRTCTKNTYFLIFSKSGLILKKNKRQLKDLKLKLHRRDMQLILLQTACRGIPANLVLCVPRSGRYTSAALHDILYRNKDNINAFLYSNFPNFSRQKLFDRTEPSSSLYSFLLEKNLKPSGEILNVMTHSSSPSDLRDFNEQLKTKSQKSRSKSNGQKKSNSVTSSSNKTPVYPKPVPNGLSTASEVEDPSTNTMFPFTIETPFPNLTNSDAKESSNKVIMDSQSGKAPDKLTRRKSKSQIFTTDVSVLQQQTNSGKSDRPKSASTAGSKSMPTHVKGRDILRLAYCQPHVIPVSQTSRFPIHGEESSITTVADFRKLQALRKSGFPLCVSSLSNKSSVTINLNGSAPVSRDRNTPILPCTNRQSSAHVVRGQSTRLQALGYGDNCQFQMKNYFIRGRLPSTSSQVTRVPWPPTCKARWPAEWQIETRRLVPGAITPHKPPALEDQRTVSQSVYVPHFSRSSSPRGRFTMKASQQRPRPEEMYSWSSPSLNNNDLAVRHRAKAAPRIIPTNSLSRQSTANIPKSIKPKISVSTP